VTKVNGESSRGPSVHHVVGDTKTGTLRDVTPRDTPPERVRARTPILARPAPWSTYAKLPVRSREELLEGLLWRVVMCVRDPATRALAGLVPTGPDPVDSLEMLATVPNLALTCVASAVRASGVWCRVGGVLLR